MTSIRLSSAVLATALSGLLAACGSGSNNSGTTTLVEPPALVGTVTKSALGVATAPCDVNVVALNYTTPGAKANETSNASAGLLVPTGTADACKGPFPIIAYGRGTAVAPKSRTMASTSDAEMLGLAAMFASQGYMVVATDYLGYAKSAYPFHPYLHADSEATAVIDSIRAARLYALSNNIATSGKVMLYGYSQGGHTSLATQKAIETSSALAGEIRIAAAGHGASPSALGVALRSGAEILGGQYFIPFLVTAWQKVYGDVYTAPIDVFTTAYASTIEGLMPAADPAALAVLPQAPIGYTATLFQSSFTPALQAGTSGVIKAAQRNDLVNSGWNPSSPTRFCAGSQDPTVLWASSTQLALAKWGGLPNVSSLDADPAVQALAVSRGLTPTQTIAQYHGSLAPAVCLQDMLAFFNARR